MPIQEVCKPRNSTLLLYGLQTEGDLQVTSVRHVCPSTLNDLVMHRHVLNRELVLSVSMENVGGVYSKCFMVSTLHIQLSR
jgi:hypothetical protein